ncbi:hypothetical protein HANVADRAFT_40823 [Hanseniaspora valbyensis NRRL Y-1626]|uniref:Actin cytoskeleton-regulatory complex protein END3 n=1 Tax=Hanseniaspora valbyensis NRRL Y-1626 TaxID=766949 RepID=A0A1B7TBS2_9ASCO|nr:hypothetical protein HANVADRAFT_40823 [Hanseniaspora valbyensis NRRL Y-1626]
MSKLEQFEIKKYWQIFSGILKQNNTPKETKVSYDLVKPILFNSKLDSSILNKIWDLSDIDEDDSLDFEEFVICMRLLFDMVNKSIDRIPDQLPEWLIPGSKVDLLKKKLKEQKKENTSQPEEYLERENISPFNPPVEWYMSPTEKSLYEAVYSTSKLNLDKTITFKSIYEALKSKILITNLNNITELDVSKVWHLLNPSNLPQINKDPALYLIHVIKQINDKNCELPTSIPRSLAQTFQQNEIDSDLSSSNNNVHRTKIYSTPVTKSKNMTEGTDFSSIEGKDWEKIRLKQELEQLDKEYEKVSNETEKFLKPSHLNIVREQFQQLLNYKQNLLINGKTTSADLSAFKDDLEIVEEQVTNLEGYLQQRTQVLKEIQSQL